MSGACPQRVDGAAGVRIRRDRDRFQSPGGRGTFVCLTLPRGRDDADRRHATAEAARDELAGLSSLRLADPPLDPRRARRRLHSLRIYLTIQWGGSRRERHHPTADRASGHPDRRGRLAATWRQSGSRIQGASRGCRATRPHGVRSSRSETPHGHDLGRGRHGEGSGSPRGGAARDRAMGCACPAIVRLRAPVARPVAHSAGRVARDGGVCWRSRGGRRRAALLS